MPEVMSDAAVDTKLAELPGWERSGATLRKTWQLKGFLTAMTFANAIAHVAQQLDHHPDLTVHDYNQLTLVTTTHSAGGITENDFRLAQAVEGLSAI